MKFSCEIVFYIKKLYFILTNDGNKIKTVQVRKNFIFLKKILSVLQA